MNLSCVRPVRSAEQLRRFVELMGGPFSGTEADWCAHARKMGTTAVGAKILRRWGLDSVVLVPQ